MAQGNYHKGGSVVTADGEREDVAIIQREVERSEIVRIESSNGNVFLPDAADIAAMQTRDRQFELFMPDADCEDMADMDFQRSNLRGLD